MELNKEEKDAIKAFDAIKDKTYLLQELNNAAYELSLLDVDFYSDFSTCFGEFNIKFKRNKSSSSIKRNKS